MATLTSYVGSRDDYVNFGTGSTLGQSFQIPITSQVIGCAFNGSRGSTSSGTFKIEIKSTSPTGTVLATTGTLNSTVLTPYNAAGVDSLNAFTFTTPVTLSAGVTYYLIITAISGSGGDEIRWNNDNTSPTYTAGNVFTGSTSVPGNDALFSIEGNQGPILTTNAVTSITVNTAQGNGDVTSDGGFSVTARGFVWNTAPSPTLSNNVVTVSGTTGTYSGSLTGLSVGTLYYVRAYATNSAGTSYGNEVTFTTLTIPQYQLQKDIGAFDGQTYVGQINVAGTVGTITVQLGSTGTSTVIAAGAGAASFSGTYSGLSGLIITRSADFNGTIDNVYYAQVPLATTIDFSLDAVTIITAIDASVFFKRIEEKIFNSFAFYRYLDVLFKDLDGFVTVTVRNEREDNSTDISKTFSVGNPGSGTVSPFQKKRISFLIKDQAIIIGFSNANVGETFSIAEFLLIGYKKPEKLFSPSKIISMS